MEPSAFHQPPAMVPAGQVLSPWLMVQHSAAYPSELQTEPGGQSVMAAYAVTGRRTKRIGATVRADPTRATLPRKSRRVVRDPRPAAVSFSSSREARRT